MSQVGDQVDALLGGTLTMPATVVARNNDGTVQIRTEKPLLAEGALTDEFTAEAVLVYRIRHA